MVVDHQSISRKFIVCSPVLKSLFLKTLPSIWENKFVSSFHVHTLYFRLFLPFYLKGFGPELSVQHIFCCCLSKPDHVMWSWNFPQFKMPAHHFFLTYHHHQCSYWLGSFCSGLWPLSTIIWGYPIVLYIIWDPTNHQLLLLPLSNSPILTVGPFY